MMDIFKSDRILLKSGAFKSAFIWSLIVNPVFFAVSFLGFLLMAFSWVSGLLFILVISNAILVAVYFTALKKGIDRFGLVNYELRLGYIISITIPMALYDFLLNLMLTGELGLPHIGIIPLILTFLIPKFVNKGG